MQEEILDAPVLAAAPGQAGDPAVFGNKHVKNSYARWAPVYDLVFALVLRPGRKAAAAAADRLGGHVLDVGVGTGLELPMFDRRTRLTGIDLSEPMLRRAQRRVRAKDLGNVEGLVVMDAAHLAFPDAHFDAVVAPYVLTVVPDPHASLDELARVVKPGGEIILVNHVGSSQGPMAWIDPPSPNAAPDSAGNRNSRGRFSAIGSFPRLPSVSCNAANCRLSGCLPLRGSRGFEQNLAAKQVDAFRKTRFRPVKLFDLPELTLKTNDAPLVLPIVKTYIVACRVFADGLASHFCVC